MGSTVRCGELQLDGADDFQRIAFAQLGQPFERDVPFEIVDVGLPPRAQGVGDTGLRIGQLGDVEIDVLIEIQRHPLPVVGVADDMQQPVAAFIGLESAVAVTHRKIVGRRQDPYLEETAPLLLTVEFGVQDTAAGGDDLHRAAAQRLFLIGRVVPMSQLSGDDIADDLHIAVGMTIETAVGLHVVVVEYAQHAEPNVVRVLVMGEREVEIGVGRMRCAGRQIVQRGRVDLARLELLVLDEADRMLDMGFQEDIDAIVARMPAVRQTLLFSATLEGVVGRLARRVTRDAKRIDIAREAARAPRIEQRALYADDLAHKSRLLDAILRDVDLKQALVFTATKRSAEELSGALARQGFAAGALHGDMRQRERNSTLQHLRDGRMRVLVATDVAARGIDIPGITHVINFDAPRQAEDYVHRIGRTGRAGRSGQGITLVLPEQQGDVGRVAALLGHSEQFEATGMKAARAKLVYTSRRGRRSKW